MVAVRIEDKPSFVAVGSKVWISGQDNELFARFWRDSHENGLCNRLRAQRGGTVGPVTNSSLIGVSHVEKDPSDRAFFFHIAAESDMGEATAAAAGLERFVVPACRWAIFRQTGSDQGAGLFECEMHCFGEWLPSSGMTHAHAPEMEVYPADGSVEFWLPVVDRKEA